MSGQPGRTRYWPHPLAVLIGWHLRDDWPTVARIMVDRLLHDDTTAGAAAAVLDLLRDGDLDDAGAVLTARPDDQLYGYESPQDQLDGNGYLLEYALGMAYHRAGRVDEAVRWLRAAGDKGDRMALNNAGLILIESGRTEEGLPYLEQAAEGGLARAAANLGSIYYRDGDRQRGLHWWDVAGRSDDPQVAGFALRRLAAALLEQGEDERAAGYLLRAGELGDAEAARDAAAIYHQRLSDLDQARSAYERAVTLGSATAAFELGTVLVDEGQLDEAEQTPQACSRSRRPPGR
jgi:tetratricopeptide (TPR) repeat protein